MTRTPEEKIENYAALAHNFKMHERYMKIYRINLMHGLKLQGLTNYAIATLLGTDPANLSREFKRYPVPLQPSDDLIAWFESNKEFLNAN